MATKDIVIVCDYHSENMQFLTLNTGTGEERTFKLPTTSASVREVLDEAEKALLAPGAEARGKIVWIMESTTGWARVKKLVAVRSELVVANVLQLPLPPKARRRKTDKLDNRRVLREYLGGQLPVAHQPDEVLRAQRRVVALRENLVRRTTCLRNQIRAHVMHELWEDLGDAWSGKGMKKLADLAQAMGAEDRLALELKLDELRWQTKRIARVEEELLRLYAGSEAAQRLDDIPGIAEVSAIAIVLRIGPIDRHKSADALVSYAGLCPGVHQSDGTSRSLSVGGGGSDKHLRNYLIEATTWAKTIPRYQEAHRRTLEKRGKRVARIVVARLVLRSIYQMLKTGCRFNPAAA